jgi:hypothetical protein
MPEKNESKMCLVNNTFVKDRKSIYTFGLKGSFLLVGPVCCAGLQTSRFFNLLKSIG